MAERDAELRARIDPARPRRPGTIRDAATRDAATRDAATRDAATRDAATLRDAGTGRALDRPTGPLRGLPDLEPPGRTDGARRRARRDRGPHRR
jgi:hypothetical protein